ncbi:hypothetical protein C7A10_20985, partial [Pseudomonas fluorescens]
RPVSFRPRYAFLGKIGEATTILTPGVVVSAYFGPFYQGDADQSRNFGLWLVGNGVVVLGAAFSGAVWYCRRLSRWRE